MPGENPSHKFKNAHKRIVVDIARKFLVLTQYVSTVERVLSSMTESVSSFQVFFPFSFPHSSNQFPLHRPHFQQSVRYPSVL